MESNCNGCDVCIIYLYHRTQRTEKPRLNLMVIESSNQTDIINFIVDNRMIGSATQILTNRPSAEVMIFRVAGELLFGEQ